MGGGRVSPRFIRTHWHIPSIFHVEYRRGSVLDNEAARQSLSPYHPPPLPLLRSPIAGCTRVFVCPYHTYTQTHTRLILAPLCPALLYLSISSGVSGSSRAAINLLESLINRLMLDPLNGGQCLSTRNCPCPQQCTCLEIGWPVFRRIVAGMGGGIWGEVDGAVCSWY